MSKLTFVLHLWITFRIYIFLRSFFVKTGKCGSEARAFRIQTVCILQMISFWLQSNNCIWIPAHNICIFCPRHYLQTFMWCSRSAWLHSRRLHSWAHADHNNQRRPSDRSLMEDAWQHLCPSLEGHSRLKRGFQEVIQSLGPVPCRADAGKRERRRSNEPWVGPAAGSFRPDRHKLSSKQNKQMFADYLRRLFCLLD